MDSRGIIESPEQCSSSSSQADQKPTGHHGFESDSSLSTSMGSSDCRSEISLYQTIQTCPGLESPSPMRPRRASKSKQNPANCKNKNNNSISSSCHEIKNNRSCKGEVCSCAASFTADCAAICCCPCAILHLLVLAFVKVPSSFARKAVCYARKKAALRTSNRKNPADHKDDHDDEDQHRGRYSFSPWSCPDSPSTSHGSPAPPKFDTQKLWTELYEAGHIGFGGPPLHWNVHDHNQNQNQNQNHDDDDDPLEDACFHSCTADSLPRVSNG